VRELDERLGFSEPVEQRLTDPRGKNTQLPLAGLLRQSVYSRLAGYEDVKDAERLAQDPTFRLIGSEKIWERGAALTSRLPSFETEVLTPEETLAGLAAMNRELIAKAEARGSSQRVVLDMDSTEIPVYGQQEQSAYNGQCEPTCYHPLLFNRKGDCLGAKLRPGNLTTGSSACMVCQATSTGNSVHGHIHDLDFLLDQGQELRSMREHRSHGPLVRWETPRLCRGGSKSLTNTGVHRGNSLT